MWGRWARVGISLCALASMLVCVPSAYAKCDSLTKRNLAKASAISKALTAANASGAGDLAMIVSRARKHCKPGQARFAFAVARSTQVSGAPREDVRTAAMGVSLIGTNVGGAIVYRIDFPTMVSRWYAVRTSRKGDIRLTVLSQLSAVVHGGMVFGIDPTQASFNPSMQSLIAARLSRGGSARATSVARAALIAIRPRQNMRAVIEGPLLAAITSGINLEFAARVALTRDTRNIRSIERRLRNRIRLADTGGWARIDGSFATLQQQKIISKLTKRLAVIARDAALGKVASSLRAELYAKPVVKYDSVPIGSFYPWPHDGVLDSASVAVRINKPSTVTLTIYSTMGIAVDSQSAKALPGTWIGSWAGTTSTGGSILAAPGSYRYGLHVTDLAGNQTVVPGVSTFDLARDTSPPTISSASAKFTGGVTRRRFTVKWSVSEPISPHLNIVLSLRKNGVRRNVTIPSAALSGTANIAVPAPTGTHRVFVHVTDGSGNLATIHLPDVKIS